MANLTAQDSLNIMDAVDLLNEMDATGASIWGMQHLEKIPEHRRDLLLKELSKGKHKNLFNKPIETAQDTTNFANAIVSKGGTMSTYANPATYKKYKAEFMNAVNDYNQSSLEMQIMQSDLNDAMKNYNEAETRMNLIIEDEMIANDPIGPNSVSKPFVLKGMLKKYPELAQELQENKNIMIRLDAELGFKQPFSDRYAKSSYEKNISRISMDEDFNMRPRSTQSTRVQMNVPQDFSVKEYTKLNLKRNKLMQSLSSLNIFEGDQSKTVLPEEWIKSINAGEYTTLTLEEE